MTTKREKSPHQARRQGGRPEHRVPQISWTKLYEPGMSAADLYDRGVTATAYGLKILYDEAAAKCESPIERIMLAAIAIHLRLNPSFNFFVWGSIPERKSEPSARVICVSQAEIGPYRADLLLIDERKVPPRLTVIECDGHDFHERTKDQAQRDRSRDRWFTTNGITVLRFTGSEIYARPMQLADEVAEFLERS